jgi:glycosyltransferase 2 family protein
MRRILLVLLSFVGSGVLLWLVLRGLPIQEILNGLAQANPFWIGVALAMVVVAIYTRGIRWRGMLNNQIGVKESFLIMSVAFMLNLLPLRLGEVARSAIVTRHKIPFFTALTSVIVERVLDLFLVIILIAVILPTIPNVDPQVGRSVSLFGIAALAGFVVLLFFAKYEKYAFNILEFVERMLPFFKRLPLKTLIINVLNGVQPLTTWRGFGFAVSWTVICWIFSFASGYAMMMALNVDPSVAMTANVLGICFTALGLALPLSVANLGPFQAAFAFVGQLLNMDEVLAVTLGFLYNGVSVLGYTMLGLIGLSVLGLSLGDLTQKKPQE